MGRPFHTLRSPGSKGWYVPLARRFLGDLRPTTIVEPFAGSAITSLTLMNQGYCQRIVLAEKDPELRGYWETALSDSKFSDRALQWKLDVWEQPTQEQPDFVAESLARMEKTDPSLFVLLRSLLAFNGILRGRNSIGIVRPIRYWLPDTLDNSLAFIYQSRQRIEVLSDAFEALRRTDRPDNFAFVDPPYTSGKNSPGHKLYRESEVDNQALLEVLANWQGAWQLTSEYCPEMLRHLRKGVSVLGPIQVNTVRMRTGHGRKKVELVVSRRSAKNRDARS
jgi:DNA adenine methylase